MDFSERIPYRPMIMLAVKPCPLFEENRTPIEVDVVGITEKGRRFILNPKPRPGEGIYTITDETTAIQKLLQPLLMVQVVLLLQILEN